MAETIEVRLLHTACTTGWLDWGHGELWLTPDAVIRTSNPSLTWRAVRSGVRAGASRSPDISPDAPGGARIGDDPLDGLHPEPDQPIEVERDVWDDYLAQATRRRRSYVLPIAEVARFHARGGVLTVSMRFWMTDGTRRKAIVMRGFSTGRIRQLLAERLPT